MSNSALNAQSPFYLAHNFYAFLVLCLTFHICLISGCNFENKFVAFTKNKTFDIAATQQLCSTNVRLNVAIDSLLLSLASLFRG